MWIRSPALVILHENFRAIFLPIWLGAWGGWGGVGLTGLQRIQTHSRPHI